MARVVIQFIGLKLKLYFKPLERMVSSFSEKTKLVLFITLEYNLCAVVLVFLYFVDVSGGGVIV